MSIVNINNVIARTTYTSYTTKSNEYVYKVSARLIVSVCRYIQYVYVASYELAMWNKEAR